MKKLIDARNLVNYIQQLSSFEIISTSKKNTYNHIGGLITDIVLQSGMNYKTIVEPRVKHIVEKYPHAYNLSSFKALLDSSDISMVIKWSHPTKLQRMTGLIEFLLSQNIESCDDLKSFLLKDENKKIFLKINGIGAKTLDYTLKLLSCDTVAVDRHIYSFVKDAGIDAKEYFETKTIVEYAADLMGISRSSIDASIWFYMSNKKSKQFEFAN